MGAEPELTVAPPGRPSTPLVDSFGRVHRDLRISVTDRCDFRCTYCMPAEGMRWLPSDALLSFEEIARVARVLVERFGFTAIRLTGGEPLVRARLPALVAQLAPLPVDLSLTTNGARLAQHAAALADAGLRRVNISLDSLRAERFAALTRRDALADVLAGIQAARAAGLGPIKVNAVVVRGVNDDEVVDLARFGRERGLTVRFIEFMPLDGDGAWDRTAVVPRDEVLGAVHAAFPVEPIGRGDDGAEPAERFRYLDGAGEVGIIATVTDAFCGTCDRIRLTAEGQLRTCLFALEETDLRALLRGGADDDAIGAAVEGAIAGKWAGHSIERVQFIRPQRSMSQIGG